MQYTILVQVAHSLIQLHRVAWQSITYHIKHKGGQHTWVPGWLHARSDRWALPVLCWLLSIGVSLPLIPPASIDKFLPLRNNTHSLDHSMISYEDQSTLKQMTALYTVESTAYTSAHAACL